LTGGVANDFKSRKVGMGSSLSYFTLGRKQAASFAVSGGKLPRLGINDRNSPLYLAFLAKYSIVI